MNNYMTESSYFFTTSTVEINYFYSGFTTKKQEDIFHYIITGQSVQRSNRTTPLFLSYPFTPEKKFGFLTNYAAFCSAVIC